MPIVFGEYEAEQHNLQKAVKKARETYEAMSPIDRAIHDLRQKRSFIHGSKSLSDTTSREETDAAIDKRPEYVVLVAYETERARADALQARVAGLEAALHDVLLFLAWTRESDDLHEVQERATCCARLLAKEPSDAK